MAAVKPSLPTWRPPHQSPWQKFRHNPAQYTAQCLYPYRAKVELDNTAQDAISVVCISDTHNTQPDVPGGDVLLHAGNLTIGGTYVELQSQLFWLDKLPHKYKVVIAGNHDLLLDPVFVARSPHRIREHEGTSRSDLDWGSVTYLYNTTTSLTFGNGRTLTVYGSPWTPVFGSWAFQHPDTRPVWPGSVPQGVDIVLTHGPPRGLLDDGTGRGCPQLRDEIARAKPKLVVFGHIHAGRGRDQIRHDHAQQAYDQIMNGGGGLLCVLLMVLWLVIGHIRRPFRRSSSEEATTLVNCAVVGPTMDHVDHTGTVVNI
ncbi:hypothetical protein G3M48_000039 [Beauveria asiatica]|uniref:Calcineurin-like phosphoesterase domain-containing protein n=1 Tax=Beauveria asiatica TaxID=1069075 RepID=A0AAW0S978_9HYPO